MQDENLDLGTDLEPRRSEPRQFVAMIVITASVAIALGVLLRQPSMMGANDISRWCTVWSLLERGTYVIDECPWQVETQDKVKRAPAGAPKDDESAKHYYSSKPALLSTLIAGILYPARKLTGVPLDRVVLQEREERWTQKPDPGSPGGVKGVLEKPPEAVKWPAYVFYFKPVMILLNIIPFAAFLILYARFLDRYAAGDWTWFFCLVAAAFGTYLLPFTQTLNNHTVAAFSAFFAIYNLLRIWDEGRLSGWRFAAVGFFAAFAAVNEIPALAFLALAVGLLLFRFPKPTLLFFLPAAIVPLAGSVASQYAAIGEVKLVYTEFGTEAYLWEGSLWKTPLEMDALNDPWFNPEQAAKRGLVAESYAKYLFHMTLGHHGFWSLTPIFFLSLAGLIRLLQGGGRGLAAVALLVCLASLGVGTWIALDQAAWMSGGTYHPYARGLLAIPGLLGLLAFLGWWSLVRRGGSPMAVGAWITAVLTAVILAFYTWTPQARNYGGSTQGLRWLFWLIPFWLIVLPAGVAGGQTRRWIRVVSLLALLVSAMSVGYAVRNPWTHPWGLDLLEHLNLYTLPR
ncbi:hypothetical protein [Aquisphaera insulae]|uniref:hypothetical protein n=1 Tax=Aquisphaera insulae TaxID=2712864 RepID=UPI0013EB0F35|nr:hypothetical protein [Aquisphaera insulae]